MRWRSLNRCAGVIYPIQAIYTVMSKHTIRQTLILPRFRSLLEHFFRYCCQAACGSIERRIPKTELFIFHPTGHKGGAQAHLCPIPL